MNFVKAQFELDLMWQLAQVRNKIKLLEYAPDKRANVTFISYEDK